MDNKGALIAWGDANLGMARVCDPAVKEANPLKNWHEEVKLGFNVPIGHLMAAIIVRQVRVEPDLWKAPNHIDRPTDVLGYRRAMGLNIERIIMLRRGL
jgi:hypothetical protein